MLGLRILLTIIIAVTLILSGQYSSSAETPATSAPLADSDASVSVIPPETVGEEAPEPDKNISLSYQESTSRMEQIWDESLAAINAHDLNAINLKLNQLQEMQIQSGLKELPEYSNKLLLYAEAAIVTGNKEEAAYLVRKALEFSPHSPEVSVQAMPIAEAAFVATVSSQVGKVISQSLARLDTVADLVKRSIYPILWALTIGVSLTFFMLLATHVTVLMRSVSSTLPTQLRGVLAPIVVFFVLTVPLAFGPLWMMAIWSVLIILLIPKYRWFGGLGAVTILLWGLLVPIRENLDLWLNDAGVQSMLRVSSQIYSPQDGNLLQSLVNVRRDDVAALLAYEQLLRRQKNTAEARKIVSDLELLIDDSKILEIEKATLLFLEGKAEEAVRGFETLRENSQDYAPYLFNFSKAQFELMDTEKSRDLFEQANALDPELAGTLQKQEEKIGFSHPASLAQLPVPLTYIVRSALSPMEGAAMLADRRIGRLMPGLQIMQVCLIGSGILVLFLLSLGRSAKLPRAIYYSNYRHSQLLYGVLRLIPGGASVLNGRPLRAALIISTLFLMLIPIVKWPNDSSALLDNLHGLQFYYTYFVWFVVAAFCYVGFYSYDGENKICKAE